MTTILSLLTFAFGLLIFCRYAYKKNREPIKMDRDEEEINNDKQLFI